MHVLHQPLAFLQQGAGNLSSKRLLLCVLQFSALSGELLVQFKSARFNSLQRAAEAPLHGIQESCS